MKFTVNVECTPVEARQFMGLPDVTSINEMFMNSLEEKTKENIDNITDPQKYFENMMTMGGKNFETMQAMFAAMMSGGTSGKNDK
ncbi:hypothetical protein FF098_009395 [Parvularcula flava]|uniref:Uncharacterized protein n=1 Tax=Aquisalinus luteolus TaxID=1566827 RepID=A0A8J3A268_9PROT|nr:DUF6489 family protein [Aquisalinus luteolus]NHK28116.1 hypothetical protein [Aquisalinus luteolus]GGH97508.1 hypothetical protein GCM10011355_18910 [Aquisalinus luteolus]